MFYCDPPDWGTEGYGVDFDLEQYNQMAELARTIKGSTIIISVNDIPEMRKVFKGLVMKTVQISYAVGGQQERGQCSKLVILNF